jgi:putative redox protein
MAVNIDVECLGGLRTRATHGPSGTTLLTAAPKDNQGDGSSFSPTDLAATAFATCALTVMAIAARKHGVELDGATAHVEKVMSTDAPRRIVALPLLIEVPGGVPEELRERLENAARTCPVAQSLSPDVDAPMSFVWR